MQRNELVAITIPRDYLQNPENEHPLQLWLSDEKRCQHIEQVINRITTEKLISYIIDVDDDNKILNDQETKMLFAATTYIQDHFNNLNKAEPTPSAFSSSAAASCDIDTINNETLTETTATINTPNDTPTNDISADEEPLNLPLNASSSNNHQPATNSSLILDIILKIINLAIWKQKGNKILYHTLPEGIDEMRRFDTPSLDAIFSIALKQNQKPTQTTRTNMTGRFYDMLTTLHSNTIRECSEDAAKKTLAAFCQNELIIDFNNKKNTGLFRTFCKVVLSNEDVATLCEIANIQPADIESLVNNTATTNAAAADEEPQTELRP